MAFSATKEKFGQISAHSNSDIPRLWGFTTGDAIPSTGTTGVLAVGYFNDKVEDITVGDIIIATDGTAVESYLCTVNNGTVVTVVHVTV